MIKSKKHIIFDIGNVLINFSIDKMICKLSEYCNISKKDVENILNKYSHKYEMGFLTSIEFFQKFQKISKNNIKPLTLLHHASDIFEVNHSIIPLLHDLKKNYNLYLLSNTCEAHFNYLLHKFDFFKIFNEKLLSYEVFLRKPDPHIFHKALKVFNISKHECFYVDDLEENVNAAKSYGIDSEIFVNTEKFKQDLIKRNIFLKNTPT